MKNKLCRRGMVSAVLGAVAIVFATHAAFSQVITNAFDLATNYAAAGNFFAGDNQGAGFGPWQLNLGSGVQSLTSDDNLQFGQYAFTLANSAASDVSTATRPFSNALPVGGSFSVRFRLNHLDSNANTNGFQLQDAGGNVLFSFYHRGGDNNNGWYTDASGSGTATNFPYNFSAFTSLTFTLNSATSYTFKDNNNGSTLSGTLSGAPITQVTFFRANGSSAPSDGQNFDFNALTMSTLGSKPVFTLQPKNAAAVESNTVTLSTTASSNLGNPAYQWYFTNNPIAVATSTNLVLANIALTNAGNYFVVASNAAGATTSSVVSVTVIPFGYTNAFDLAGNYSSFAGNQGFGFGPWVVSTSGGGSYISGDNPPLFAIWNSTVNAASTAVRTFNTALPVGGSILVQLQMNNLANGNTNAFELQDSGGNVLFSYFHQGGDNGDGRYIDANGIGTATGFAYDYTQVDSFAFTLTSTTTYTFTDLTTGVAFSGTLSGGPITQVTFLRVNGSGTFSGGQDLRFNNLTILSPTGNPPQFSQQPQYGGGLAGSTVNLTGTAVSSSGALGYQWYFGNTVISGATNSTLTLGNASTTNSGSYFLVASNAFGAVTSAVSVVTVYVENSRLFAYEGFNYDGGPSAIDGVTQNGGLGWSNAWVNISGSGNDIIAGGLIADTNAPAGFDARSSGNSYYNFGNSRAGRFLDTSTNGPLALRGYLDANGNIGAAGKTIYVSFLIQPDVTGLFYEFEFHRNDLGDPGRIAGVGNDRPGNNVFFRQPNGTFADLGLGDSFEDPTFGNHAVDFYVVRIDFQPGHADNVRVYRNPTSITEPNTASIALTNVGNMSFNGISLGAFGNYLAADEIRLGATWADVLGVSTPGSMLLPVKQGVNWQIPFAGNPGTTYRVQRAFDLTSGWTDIGTATPLESGAGTVSDTNSPAGQAFYRTVTP